MRGPGLRGFFSRVSPAEVFLPLVLCGVALLGGAAWAGGAGHGQSPEPPAKRSVNDGVYSKPQAERGAKGYRAHCLRCHTTDAFTGSYMAAWYGQTANGLFELIHASMPQDNPGGLSREEVVDLLTFVFKENGWPAGATDLASTRDALEQVVIEAPAKRQP